MFLKIATSVLIVMILIFIVLFGYSFLKTKSIEKDYPPIGNFVSTLDNEVEVHYLREGTGIPVVMLHGRDGTLQEYTLSIFDDIADKYEAIAFDRPGYGYSKCLNSDNLTTKKQAKIINEAINKMEVENPIIIGHSYGGAVMLQYLLDYPDQVRGAISLAGVSYVDEPPNESFYALPRYPVIGSLLTNTIVLPLGTIISQNIYDLAFRPIEPPKKYVKVISSLYLRPEQFKATSYELSHMYDSVNSLSDDYKQILTPVTIIFGDSDELLEYKEDGERLHKELPNSKYVLIEDGGHKIHYSHPSIILYELDELVDRTK